MAEVDPVTIVFIGFLLVMVLPYILSKSVRIILPYETGLVIRLGSYKRKLKSGFNMVIPMIDQVIKVDLRTKVLDVPRQEVITKDNSPTVVDAIIYVKVMKPALAIFEIDNYIQGTVSLAQTILRSLIGDMELDELLSERAKINAILRTELDRETDKWGVKVERVEIKEVDPVGPVKAAMEEQTSAEREKRAAILRADGKKQSDILVAEGDKRSRILQAEGTRQSKILEAEGERLKQILEAQGEAQKLRILSVGAATLDHRPLTVLSLNALTKMANGKATKIIFPFELTKLMEGVSEYVGAGRKDEPERRERSLEDIERMVGNANDILGEIPTVEKIKKELEVIEKEMEVETQTAHEIAEAQKKGKKSKFDTQQD